MAIGRDIWRSIAVTLAVGIPLMFLAVGEVNNIEIRIEDRLGSLADAATTSVEHNLAAQARLQIELADENLGGSLDGDELAWASATARSAFSMVLDESGRVLSIYPERPTLVVGDEIGSKFVHFRTALAGDVGIWSAGNVAAVESGAIVALAVPFDTTTGRRVFSSAFSLGDGPLIAQMEAIMRPAGAAATFGIFNAEGILISAQTPEFTISPERILGPNGDKRGLAASLAAIDTLRIEDESGTLLTMTRPISGTDWQLLVTGNVDDIRIAIGAPAPVESYAVVAVMLIVVFGMTLLGFVMRSQRNEARALGAEIATTVMETKATIEQTPVAMVVTRNGMVRDCNLAFETLTGWTLDESRGRAFPQMLAPTETDDSIEVPAALAAGQSVSMTQDVVTRSGGTKTVLCQIRPIFDAATGVVGAIHQLADVTDLRLAETAAVALAERAEQEVRGTAHDLKSPIVAMIGYAEFLSDDWASLSVDLAREMTGRISSAGQRALEMIDERMAPQIESETNASSATISEACAWVEEILGGTIQVDFTGSADHVDIEEQALRTVLLNLATNSVKYATPGTPPRISVTAARVGDIIEIDTSDNGIGIGDHLAGKVFETGYQLDSSSIGTGHGLAMVSELIGSLGGTIEIVGQAEPGTAFSIRVPEGQRSTSPITGSNDAMVATVSAISESDIMIGNA